MLTHPNPRCMSLLVYRICSSVLCSYCTGPTSPQPRAKHPNHRLSSEPATARWRIRRTASSLNSGGYSLFDLPTSQTPFAKPHHLSLIVPRKQVKLTYSEISV